MDLPKGTTDPVSATELLPALCSPLVSVLHRWAGSCWLTGPSGQNKDTAHEMRQQHALPSISHITY